jgi:hypothetical protein
MLLARLAASQDAAVAAALVAFLHDADDHLFTVASTAIENILKDTRTRMHVARFPGLLKALSNQVLLFGHRADGGVERARRAADILLKLSVDNSARELLVEEPSVLEALTRQLVSG